MRTPDKDAHDAGYHAFHAPRYTYLLQLLAKLGVGKNSRILDIGPSRFTEMARDRFDTRIDTLGFGADATGERGNHFEYDLNRAQNREDWRTDLPSYDVIVMAEVIEHLHTAPQATLGFVASLLAPGGALILQTPNAASFTKRVKLLLGKNPYEMIRDAPGNPGHFREYTLSELRALAEELGLAVELGVTAFYFDTRFVHDAQGKLVRKNALGAIRNLVYGALPAPLREGITMVMRKANA